MSKFTVKITDADKQVARKKPRKRTPAKRIKAFQGKIKTLKKQAKGQSGDTKKLTLLQIKKHKLNIEIQMLKAKSK